MTGTKWVARLDGEFKTPFVGLLKVALSGIFSHPPYVFDNDSIELEIEYKKDNSVEILCQFKDPHGSSEHSTIDLEAGQKAGGMEDRNRWYRAILNTAAKYTTDTDLDLSITGKYDPAKSGLIISAPNTGTIQRDLRKLCDNFQKYEMSR